MNGYPGVGEYVEQMKLKFIKDFAPQKSRLRDLNESISAQDHFEHLKYVLNELYNISQKNLVDEILCLTVLTPRYPASYFDFFNPDFVSKILQNVSMLDLQEIMFHSLVQFLLPQEPAMSVKLLKLIFSKQFQRPDVMDRLFDFWSNLETLPEIALQKTSTNSNELNETISKKVSMLVQILRSYRDTRKKSNSIIPLPSFTFFPVVNHISQILSDIDFNNSLPLLTLLAIEPLFAFPMVEKLPQPISVRNLPPLSMVYQVLDPLPHSFVSMYRPILMPIFELFGIFAKFTSPEKAKIMISQSFEVNSNQNTNNSISNIPNSPNQPATPTPTTINISLAPFHHPANPILNSQLSITQICQNFLKVIESGPAGRDAFSLSLLSLCRADKNNYVAERFYNYVSDKTINSVEHDICVAGFIFAFDSVPFPSTSVLLDVDSEHLLKAMQCIHDNYSFTENNSNKNQNKKRNDSKKNLKSRNAKGKNDSYKGNYKSGTKNNDNDEYKDNDYDENDFGNNEYENEVDDDDDDGEENDTEMESSADLDSDNFTRRIASPFAMKVDHVYQCFTGNDPKLSLLTSAYALIYAYKIDHLGRNQNEINNRINSIIKTPRRGRKPKNKRAQRVIKNNKIKKHSYSNLIQLITDLSKRLNEPEYFIAFCCLVESHAKNYFEREKPSTIQNPTINYVTTVTSLLMNVLPMKNFPIWHYLYMLRENAISSAIKLISFEDLITFMRDPIAPPSKLLGAAFVLIRFISCPPNRTADYIKLLSEGNPPRKVLPKVKTENKNEFENENKNPELIDTKQFNPISFPPSNSIQSGSASIEMTTKPIININQISNLNSNHTSSDQGNIPNVNHKPTSNISSPPLNLLIPKQSSNENIEQKSYDFNNSSMIQKQIEQQQKAQSSTQFQYHQSSASPQIAQQSQQQINQPPPLPSQQPHQPQTQQLNYPQQQQAQIQKNMQALQLQIQQHLQNTSIQQKQQINQYLQQQIKQQQQNEQSRQPHQLQSHQQSQPSSQLMQQQQNQTQLRQSQPLQYPSQSQPQLIQQQQTSQQNQPQLLITSQSQPQTRQPPPLPQQINQQQPQLPQQINQQQPQLPQQINQQQPQLPQQINQQPPPLPTSVQQYHPNNQQPPQLPPSINHQTQSQPQLQQQRSPPLASQMQPPRLQQFQQQPQYQTHQQQPLPQPIRQPSSQLQPPPQLQQYQQSSPIQKYQQPQQPQSSLNLSDQFSNKFSQIDENKKSEEIYRINDLNQMKTSPPPSPPQATTRDNQKTKIKKPRGRPRLKGQSSTTTSSIDDISSTLKRRASLEFNLNDCCCYTLSFLTNTATKLAIMELPQSYQVLCELMNFSAYYNNSKNTNISSMSGNYNESQTNDHFGPMFEDSLIEEIDRLSRKFGYRFFFRVSTALLQNSDKFPSFLASYPNHGETFLNIMSSFVEGDEEESSNELGEEEKQLLQTTSFIWTWKSLGCCNLFVDIFGLKLASLILMSYHADPSSEFFFKNLSLVISSQFSHIEQNKEATENFFNALHLDMMEKSPLFCQFVNSLPPAFDYLKPSNMLCTAEILDVDLKFPIDYCMSELTGKCFSFGNQS